MKRIVAILIAVAALSLSACGTLAGTAIGGGIGSTQGKTGTGMAIGGGLGMLYDISR
jgi:predicted small secreted protein